MHPAQIKAALEMAGYTQAAIAERLGVQRNTVGDIVNGRGRSATIERQIALTIGRPIFEIWPDRYDRRGKPIKSARRRVSTADALAVARTAFG